MRSPTNQSFTPSTSVLDRTSVLVRWKQTDEEVEEDRVERTIVRLDEFTQGIRQLGYDEDDLEEKLEEVFGMLDVRNEGYIMITDFFVFGFVDAPGVDAGGAQLRRPRSVLSADPTEVPAIVGLAPCAGQGRVQFCHIC
mmetsp:Transcript_66390/g.151906  ORF Transcript_66390/g.151906 Transcript_66390/m.151906 type:complete len:139 (+) Transcript_66390:82-498(+)